MKYANELTVIGVHSAKFPNEKETDNVEKAVRRYQLDHPVINDGQFQIWQQYSCRAWPTLMFIDPKGNVVGKHEGEMSFEAFDGLISQMVAEYESDGTLDHRSMPSRYHQPADTPLSFPGKVLADGPGDRLFIRASAISKRPAAQMDAGRKCFLKIRRLVRLWAGRGLKS